MAKLDNSQNRCAIYDDETLAPIAIVDLCDEQYDMLRDRRRIRVELTMKYPGPCLGDRCLDTSIEVWAERLRLRDGREVLWLFTRQAQSARRRP